MAAKKPKPPLKGYRALVGLTLADGTRIEPGELVEIEVVEASSWLFKQGLVEQEVT